MVAMANPINKRRAIGGGGLNQDLMVVVLEQLLPLASCGIQILAQLAVMASMQHRHSNLTYGVGSSGAA